MGWTLHRRLDKETDEQCHYIYWLSMSYPKVKTIISPIVKFGTAKQRIIHGRIMKAMGYTKGTLDIFLPEPRQGFHGLFIELKTDEGTTSPDQHEMIAYLTSRGYKTAICKGSDQAIKATMEYFS
jgi:hypothetical protein